MLGMAIQFATKGGTLLSLSNSTYFNDFFFLEKKVHKIMALTPVEIDALYGIHRVLVFKNGLEVERKARYPMPKPKPPLKKGIFEMTKKSKLKLTHIITNCDVNFVSLFTLTYGDYINPLDGRELKRELNVFLNRFRRRFSGHEYVWFLEFTKRERPHIDVITTVMPNQLDRIWLGECWSKISVYDAVRRILEEESEVLRIIHSFNMFDVLDECKKVWAVHKHVKNWEKVRKSDGAMRYALKYATKAEQKLVPPQFGNVGRFWGSSRGVGAKPIAEVLIGETMSEDQIKGILGEINGYQFPLIPRYIFQRDALKFFQSRGLQLTEIFGKYFPPEIDEKPEPMVQSSS